MFNIIFYYDHRDHSDVEELLNTLRAKAATNKDARIQLKQIAMQMDLLQLKGTNLPKAVIKYLGNDLWELRPGVNRIFLFLWIDNTFVLLHHFRKKTNKTPRIEIQKALIEKDDFLKRNTKKI